MKDFKYYLESMGEIGFVEESVASLAYCSGLPNAHPQEIVFFESGETGQVISLDENHVEVLVFARYPLRVGTRIVRTGTPLAITAGPELLGQVVDPFGHPIDRMKAHTAPQSAQAIEMNPIGISGRKKITKHLETGVTIVDMLVPLGKGQRELVIGDRKTGKTNFLLQTISHQTKQGVLCIYAAIGKKKLDIKKVEDYFIKNGISQNAIIIASSSEDPTSIIYLTPYSAMSLAEYFKDQGRDVLLILDDLTSHAKFYREIALLGKRFPGRNAYPADIFYAHARLLERAGNFITKNGENSITCLPVVETVQGDITGYIQTNLMSMTDGHIYFDVELFTKGRRPAINPFLSVTRVGRQTQTDLKRTISRELISFLTLREKVENFTHFGAEVNLSIKEVLATGERIISFFNQSSEEVIHANNQLFLFGLLWYGRWRNASLAQMDHEMKLIIERYKSEAAFKQQVDGIVAQAKSLNEMLTLLRKSQDQLLQPVADGSTSANFLPTQANGVAPATQPVQQTPVGQPTQGGSQTTQ